MSKRKSNPTSCLAFLLIGACLLLAGAGWVLVELPRQAEAVFGPASPHVSLFQRSILAGKLLLQAGSLTTSLGFEGPEQDFVIQAGEAPGEIARRLEEAGLVKSGQALLDYWVYAGLDTTIQAGVYRFSPAMTAVEIANVMQDATPSEVTFVILPGWRMEEIAAALPTSGLNISPDEFLARASLAPAGVIPLSEFPSGATLEGFLFPGQYQVSRNSDAASLVVLILRHFSDQVSHDLLQGFQSQGLTLYQAVTLASIVQREAVVADEMPAIASVFLNRLAIGMKMDSDPTVQYALGYDSQRKTWWTNPLSLDHLQVASPYNTYQNPGLPPGPIANPGLSALQAVAFPAQTGYYFFRAACDRSGRHLFATTYEEHLQNACP